MLCWKNKPINELSKDELRVALSESVRLILTNDKNYSKDKVLSAFLVGSFSGVLLAGTIIVTALSF